MNTKDWLQSLDLQGNATQVKIVNFLLENETHKKTNTEITKLLELTETTFDRNVKTLRETELLSKYLPLKLIKSPPKENRNFILPYFVKEGILPPTFNDVHRAAMLSKFNMNDHVPSLNMTKTKYMEQRKTTFFNNQPELTKLTHNLQENLATFALIVGDVSAFANMKGKLLEGGENEKQKEDSA